MKFFFELKMNKQEEEGEEEEKKQKIEAFFSRFALSKEQRGKSEKKAKTHGINSNEL